MSKVLKNIMLRRMFALVTLLVLVCQSSCISYKFNGASIDYSVYKTVSISQFPIRAALVYPPLQQMFENQMNDMIIRQTRLSITDNTNSDIRLEGEITGYDLTPQAVNENAYASKTRLTISVHVKYMDNKKEGGDIDQTFSAYRDFSSDELLTDVQDELCNQICKELSDLIFNSTFGNW